MKLINDGVIEEAVLGSILVFGSEKKQLLRNKFTPELFYSRGKYKIIAEAIYDLMMQGVEIDVLNVVAKLESKDKLDAVGGRMYFTGLIDKAWSSTMIEYHLDILISYKIKRMAERSAAELVDMAGDKDSDILEIQRKAGELTKDMLIVGDKDRASFIGNLIDEFSNDMIDMAINEEFGMSSGYHNIDKTLRGLNPTYILIAGRPGNGKTAFAMNMAFRQARKGHTVGFISIEMSKQSLLERFTSIQMKKAWFDKSIYANDDAFRKAVKDAHMEVAKLPIIIDDHSYNSVDEVVSAAYNMRFSDNPIEVLYIDYLQLLSKTNKPEDLSYISHMINALKKELEIPIVGLLQINREVRDRKGHRPVLTDLKGSGTFEEDADIVMFVFDPEQWSEQNSPFELIVAKYRNGPIAMGEKSLKFFFDKPAQRFVEAAMEGDYGR